MLKKPSVPLLYFADEPPFRKELNPARAWAFPGGWLNLPRLHLAVFSEPLRLQMFKCTGTNMAVEDCSFV